VVTKSVRLPRVATPLGPAWPAILATVGQGGASAGHSHHAMHLVVARGGVIGVRVGKDEVFAPGVLTAPDVPHAIDATDREVLLVFVDPESTAGLRLQAGMTASVRALSEDERTAIFAAASADVLRWGADAVDRLAGLDPSSRTVHPRVRKLLKHLQSLPAEGDTSLAALAEIAGLSEGRLAHAFRESVGIPPRLYVLWLKLQRAALSIVSGESLVRAAALAGFSDAAHMTRTFRRMFGMAPSALRRT